MWYETGVKFLFTCAKKSAFAFINSSDERHRIELTKSYELLRIVRKERRISFLIHSRPKRNGVQT